MSRSKTLSKLKELGAPRAVRSKQMDTFWKGPVADGITFSLLSNFVVCRERFRLQVVDGLREDEGFNDAIESGSMWHEMEEALAWGKDPIQAAKDYGKKLRKIYGSPAQDQITKWVGLCSRVFPIYVDWWTRHPFVKGRKPIMAEVSFRVPYKLPSGRTLTLRGKMDAVWSKARGIWLQENKMKGDIDEEGILHTLTGQLQVMIYQTALRLLRDGHGTLDGYVRGTRDPQAFWKGTFRRKDPGPPAFRIPKAPVKGVVYNVIRRPLSDRHSIRPRKTDGEDKHPAKFWDRFAQTVKEDPGHHFKRWEGLIHDTDLERFQDRILNPLLEDLLDWWDWIIQDPDNPWRKPKGTVEDILLAGLRPGVCGGGIHTQTPWGCYNSLARGFRGDYFQFLTTGATRNLIRVDTLFPEL